MGCQLELKKKENQQKNLKTKNPKKSNHSTPLPEQATRMDLRAALGGCFDSESGAESEGVTGKAICPVRVLVFMFVSWPWSLFVIWLFDDSNAILDLCPTYVKYFINLSVIRKRYSNGFAPAQVFHRCL